MRQPLRLDKVVV